MIQNQKIIDTQRVINYINSFLDNVRVEDIIQNSGADKLRVYPALFELEQSGFLEVVEREENHFVPIQDRKSTRLNSSH